MEWASPISLPKRQPDGRREILHSFFMGFMVNPYPAASNNALRMTSSGAGRSNQIS